MRFPQLRVPPPPFPCFNIYDHYRGESPRYFHGNLTLSAKVRSLDAFANQILWSGELIVPESSHQVPCLRLHFQITCEHIESVSGFRSVTSRSFWVRRAEPKSVATSGFSASRRSKRLLRTRSSFNGLFGTFFLGFLRGCETRSRRGHEHLAPKCRPGRQRQELLVDSKPYPTSAIRSRENH